MSEMTPVQVEDALACDYAGETAIGLLDALLDSMTLARPGHDAARFAGELRRLGDGAGFVAQELATLLSGTPEAVETAPERSIPARRVSAG